MGLMFLRYIDGLDNLVQTLFGVILRMFVTAPIINIDNKGRKNIAREIFIENSGEQCPLQSSNVSLSIINEYDSIQ